MGWWSRCEWRVMDSRVVEAHVVRRIRGDIAQIIDRADLWLG